MTEALGQVLALVLIIHDLHSTVDVFETEIWYIYILTDIKCTRNKEASLEITRTNLIIEKSPQIFSTGSKRILKYAKVTFPKNDLFSTNHKVKLE